MAKDFIPKKDGDLAVWLGNFQTQLGTSGTTFGLTATEVSDTSTACTDTFTKIGAADTKKNEQQQATKDKDASKKSTIAIIRAIVRRIKAHPTYTEAKGQLYNIIGGEDAEANKPDATAILVPHGVEVGFNKYQFDGVNVYRKRAGETAFTKLAFDKVSPYIDNEPLLVTGQPEKREYQLIGVIDDDEVEQPSDVVSVVFGG